MVDHSTMKLGKCAPKHDPKVRLFARYSESLPAPKPVNWLKGETNFGMLCNDALGCCTISSKGHGAQVVTMNVRGEWTPADTLIKHYYALWDGWNPNDPATDQGGVISAVLAKMQAQSFGGHHLGGYCSVDPMNDLHVDQAIALFADLDVGLALPLSAQNQDVWDIPEGQALIGDYVPNSWGGHDVSIHGFDENGDLTCITWGAPKVMTRRWFKAYCDEAYALLWAAWIANNGLAPSGVNYVALAKDMNELRVA